ncbi:MAG: hypothetical protein JW864_10545 [Spirochaetes bacterium]|nr:hypothetical protein [Spirochaetota bacterium]
MNLKEQTEIKEKKGNSYIQIEVWSREVFALPETAEISVSEDERGDEDGTSVTGTQISIRLYKRTPSEYTIQKPASEIIREDIEFLKDSIENYLKAKHPLRSKIYKFLGWWFIFAGGITVFSVCPICGQMGCPVGIGTTGILAGMLALIKTGGRNFFAGIKSYFKALISNNQ